MPPKRKNFGQPGWKIFNAARKLARDAARANKQQTRREWKLLRKIKDVLVYGKPVPRVLIAGGGERSGAAQVDSKKKGESCIR